MTPRRRRLALLAGMRPGRDVGDFASATEALTRLRAELGR